MGCMSYWRYSIQTLERMFRPRGSSDLDSLSLGNLSQILQLNRTLKNQSSMQIFTANVRVQTQSSMSRIYVTPIVVTIFKHTTTYRRRFALSLRSACVLH